MKCEYCGKKIEEFQLVCRNCFSPFLELESFDEFADYVDELVNLRKENLGGLDYWKMRQRVAWINQDLEVRLTERGALFTPAQDANGFWTTPSGFISRENPGPMMVTKSGFMSPLQMNLSSQAEEYLMGILTDQEEERLAKGYVLRAGICPSCSSRIKKNAILCSKCFGPCIPQNSFDGRAAYGEAMTHVGEELAAEDSPKFEIWQNAMNLALKDIKNQVKTSKRNSSAPRGELRPPFKYWIIAFSGSIAFGFFVTMNFGTSESRFTLGCWAFVGALVLFSIGFFKLFVKCPNCHKFSYSNQSRQHRTYLGSQTGYHTEYRQTTTFTDFSNSRGRHIGSATSYSSTPVDVEHVEDIYSDLHQCTYCGAQFYKQVITRS